MAGTIVSSISIFICEALASSENVLVTMHLFLVILASQAWGGGESKHYFHVDISRRRDYVQFPSSYDRVVWTDA